MVYIKFKYYNMLTTIINNIKRYFNRQYIIDLLDIEERILFDLQLSNDHDNWRNKTLLNEIRCQIRLIRRIKLLLENKYNLSL